MKKADIGLVGLAVMGENLVMNMASKGFTVAVYNRTTEKVKACSKIKYLSVAHMFAEAIDRIYEEISVSPLFT